VKKANNKRALKVIRMLRLRHQKQAQQVDILCRDMVSAHQQFAVKLSRMIQVADFYESLLGCSTLQETLNTAIACIEEHIPSAGAAVFLLDENAFEIHSPNELLPEGAPSQFQDWFSRDLVLNISLTPRACSLTQMLQLGLQGPPFALKNLSAAAIPLSRAGHAVGFIWIYRSAQNPLTAEELARASAITTGLCHAILNFQNSVKQPLS
jgi:hypothetical protein